MIERIKYLDEEQLKISFFSLVIRVKAINENFGSLSNFVNKFDLRGKTNGKIFIIIEMMDPPHELNDIVQNKFPHVGLNENEDFVLVFEQNAYDLKGDINPYIGEGHPACRNAFWLNSKITFHGNYVWNNDDLN